MSEIKKLKKSVDADVKGMLEMVNVIKKEQIDLKSLDLENEISNSTIISMIEEKLPEPIEKE